MTEDNENKELPSAKEVEQAMLDKVKEKEQNIDPAEVAAQLFTLYLPRYFAHVDNLSSNALRRLCKALVEVPLNDTPYNHTSPQEKEAFAIGDRLIQAKFMLIQASFYENENNKALQEATDPNVEPETEGESNGQV